MTLGEHSVLDAWLTGVNTGRLDEVVALYDDSAILLPTFSKTMLSDHQSIANYFKGISNRGRVLVTLLDNTLSIQALGDSLEAVSGFYDWHFIDEDILVKARFTYLVDSAKPSPILHHHSSLLP